MFIVQNTISPQGTFYGSKAYINDQTKPNYQQKNYKLDINTHIFYQFSQIIIIQLLNNQTI